MLSMHLLQIRRKTWSTLRQLCAPLIIFTGMQMILPLALKLRGFFSFLFFTDQILINYGASKSETLNGHCVHIKLLLLSMRAEDPWVNIDQEIRRTVCRNNLVYPALGLAGMSLSKKKKGKK